MTAGTLFVVATPIGNLEDMSPRARRILSEVDVIAAEDTRHTGKLLSYFAIDTRQLALHDHNESKAVNGIIEMLRKGKSVALVSDAGTPLISDPGYRIVRAAHQSGIAVIPIPGASAAIAAMSAAGLPSDRFAFEGFLPSKREARLDRLRTFKAETRTLLFFESVHRIEDCVTDLVEIFGPDRNAFIGREISKLHEQCVSGPLHEIAEQLQSGTLVSKGEFVLIVAGSAEAEHRSATVDADELLTELLSAMPGSQAADIVSKLSGQNRNEVYKKMLALKS